MLKKGFTLIELLVVIAIIGLISAIILVNARDARFKANNANIQSLMHQVRNAAEMSYVENGETYDQVCAAGDRLSSDGVFGILKTAIEKENSGQQIVCIEASDKKSFAVSSPLMAKQDKYWCVESAGLSQEIDNPISGPFCQ